MRNKPKAVKSAVLLLAVIMLFTLPVYAAELPDELIPIGHTAGIRMSIDGVIIVALSSVETSEGKISPAAEAGFKPGDIIKSIDNKEVNCCADFKTLLDEGCGKNLCFEVSREGNWMDIFCIPARSVAGCAELGAWIRDSIAGIGTVTFYDPENGIFGTLGHGINDMDTGVLLPISGGDIVYSTVEGVTRGAAGMPGELHGCFDFNAELGTLTINESFGVFGKMSENCLTENTVSLPVAERSEIRVGPASIYANIDGDEVGEYSIEITRVYPSNEDNNKCMLITVTDERLLEKTGGIVQGMSGSPIIQNGKIIGAVTHVLVNDPVKGYAISIEKMLSGALDYLEAAA